ncbi:DUF1972 domain-containing protein [candidate division KSB1 bacterium]
MKIAILGTRGIPNEYGGFEQFAEKLSEGLVKKGMDITVYSVHHHSYRKSTWNGVNIIHKKDPVKLLKTAGQFMYDLRCIIDSRKHQYDIIYQLGYTSSSIWFWLHPKKAKIITNIDGFEYERAKYNPMVQRFLRRAEKLAVKHSDILVADSVPIKNYIEKKFNINAVYIPYGSNLFTKPDPSVLPNYNLEADKYSLVIARFQTDNNFEMIIDGYLKSNQKNPLVLIGNYENKFGHYLQEKYSDKRLIYLGPIFNQGHLDNLRFFSKLYFHGHSAGGTNPSLLEAMGAGTLIAAHNNPYNKDVLGENAYYFNSAIEIENLLNNLSKKTEHQKWIDNNKELIKIKYNWDTITDTYYQFFISS